MTGDSRQLHVRTSCANMMPQGLGLGSVGQDGLERFQKAAEHRGRGIHPASRPRTTSLLRGRTSTGPAGLAHPALLAAPKPIRN